MKTSILDRFCASLCEAVLGEPDTGWNARTCLDWIERSELFVISLDNIRDWYRYHHLFQELLQKRLSAEMTPDQVNDLHRLASAWFEEHGLIDEALHHALAAGDLDLAARQMSAGMRDTINREDWPTLERWLRLLPEEMIQRRPELLMIRVWFLELSWRLDLQAVRCSSRWKSCWIQWMQVRRFRRMSCKSCAGRSSCQKPSWHFSPTRHAQAIELCREVLALLPPSWTFVRGGAMLYLGLSMQASGQAQAAERLLLNEYAVMQG